VQAVAPNDAELMQLPYMKYDALRYFKLKKKKTIPQLLEMPDNERRYVC